ncbi:MAG: dihydroorotate dehydrogenase-like protein [Alphaproteobacteria bacterium]|nr:dihydroorotate dehydrogenase-like protein [Alphaproteobacteria bacterium]
MMLATRYLGLDLRNPLVASASPLNAELDNIRRLEDAGIGAVVLPSVFEEQLVEDEERLERLISTGIDSVAEAASYLPAARDYGVGTDRYLDLIARARRAVGVPVIASLNGVTDHGWIGYARDMESAGAQAIELNVFWIPTDLSLSGRDVEERVVDILASVKAAVSIPVAIKLSPYFSAIGHMARRLDAAGADGLVLFNRFYQPDIDLAAMRLSPDLKLSHATEIRLPLLWIGVLHGQVRASLAATSGVQGADEVIKYVLAGADAVMTTAALLRHGIAHATTMVTGLGRWLEARGFASVADARGRLSRRHVANPEAFERGNYIRILQSHGH